MLGGSAGSAGGGGSPGFLMAPGNMHQLGGRRPVSADGQPLLVMAGGGRGGGGGGGMSGCIAPSHHLLLRGNSDGGGGGGSGLDVRGALGQAGLLRHPGPAGHKRPHNLMGKCRGARSALCSTHTLPAVVAVASVCARGGVRGWVGVHAGVQGFIVLCC